MKFLITGCARSGTGYTVEVLRQLGVPVGWETAFNPDTINLDWQGAEVAWEAVPFLRQLDGVPVAHQVRHPLAVIRSLALMGLFAEPSRKFGHAEFIYKYMPFLRTGSQLERCARYWLYWNMACSEYATQRYQVEQMTTETLAPLIGYLPDALPDVPKDTNGFGGVLRLSWEDVPMARRIRQMAEEYGYDV